MKRTILACMVTVVTAAPVFADRSFPVPEIVLRVFHEVFPEAKATSWHSFENGYEVYFTDRDMSSVRIYYNACGMVLSAKRYYLERSLPSFLRAKVKERFSGKAIFGVTGLFDGQKVLYYIVLEDDQNWYNIEVDATGSIRKEMKLERNG